MSRRDEIERTAPRLQDAREPEDTLVGETSRAAADTWEHVERVGRYRLERVLGEGGFGRVYLAHDEQLDRQVAIKLPHPHLVADKGDTEDYLAEARTVAGLDHAHIVPVYGVGSTEQFPLYVVSKYIDGTDLAAELGRGRISIPKAVGLVATVAEALHYTHTRGLVHRDVKPGNTRKTHSVPSPASAGFSTLAVVGEGSSVSFYATSRARSCGGRIAKPKPSTSVKRPTLGASSS